MNDYDSEIFWSVAYDEKFIRVYKILVIKDNIFFILAILIHSHYCVVSSESVGIYVHL